MNLFEYEGKQLMRRWGIPVPESHLLTSADEPAPMDFPFVLKAQVMTGGRGKAGGEVYLLAARRLNVPPEDCAVFEDVLAGVAGAKRVGMRAYCVRDAHSEKDFPAMAALADGCVDTLDQMRAYHDFVE